MYSVDTRLPVRTVATTVYTRSNQITEDIDFGMRILRMTRDNRSPRLDSSQGFERKTEQERGGYTRCKSKFFA